jgi:hypothetical protein
MSKPHVAKLGRIGERRAREGDACLDRIAGLDPVTCKGVEVGHPRQPSVKGVLVFIVERDVVIAIAR